jgi:hypothetical protein|eukprot:COSAG06_NODE_50_length_28525_cov_88.227010_32_plen_96_part_00
MSRVQWANLGGCVVCDHSAQWVLTTASSGSSDVLLNGKPAVAGGALPSVSGHDGRGFGSLVLPPQSVSFVRLGLIPNCQQCELWQGEGGNSSCIP